MLQIGFIREKPGEVINRLKVKNFDAEKTVRQLIELDDNRRQTRKNLDEYFAEANKIAKNIGMFFKQGRGEEANEMKNRSVELKQLSKKLVEELEIITGEFNQKLILLPNLPHPSVPTGKTAEDNELIFENGSIPELPKNALPHWELASKYDIINFDLGSKVTGAGFPFYKGAGAKLQRALINFFLDEGTNAGYVEYQPPLLVNEASAYSTGQLPDKDGQMYDVPVDNFYLIPTAEVPLTNIYRNVILKEDDFPVKIVAYSSCFRREAGSYGKDVRGLNRLHQFDKVEVVQIQKPENSYQALEEMKDYVASLLVKLKLPFRIVRLCGGDLSFTSALTYDFEVFSAAQKKWLEVSSVSNFESFQTNRMKLRYKNKSGKTTLAHTLNGSALALPRIVAALLENNQTEDGIKIPAVLTDYTGFDKIG